ncbi:MAG: VOC family protein [Acidobacteriota bacterium]
MAQPVKPIPEGFHTITPHLTIPDASAAIEFYKKAFGAEEIFRMPSPDGKIMHAEIRIGDSPIMLNDEMPDYGCRGPKMIGGSPVTIHLYVTDADAFMKRAEEAGAKVEMPLQDQFWGDRYGKIEDPFGHKWSIATHIEDPTPEQVAERAKKFFEA